MRLDLSSFKYLSHEDFRVLTAIELGMRNHEIVPVSLINSIAKLKKTNVNRVIANLLKHKLIEHTNIKYDGYSLNFIGYDYLALHALMRRGILVKLGPKLGVGKESDVFICYVDQQVVEKMDKEELEEKEITEEEFDKIRGRIDAEEEGDPEQIEENKESDEIQQEEEHIDIDTMVNKFEEELNILDKKCHIAVIKFARLGRVSFRAVKNKRDYVKDKSHYNWLYLSRVSAINEYKFLKGLYNTNSFPVPKPYDQNRHAILMEYIPSYSLCRIDELGDKEKAYNELINIVLKLSSKGLIHGDFNEFNILCNIGSKYPNQKMFMIDFPQMISIDHEDAKVYFERDVQCINKFFIKKFGMTFENSEKNYEDIVREEYLDVKLKAYGHEHALEKNKMALDKIKDDLYYKEDSLIEEDQDDDLEELNPDEEHEDFLEKPTDKHDLNFDKKDLIEPNDKKIEIDNDYIKEKVKRMLNKKNKIVGKTSNRFKNKTQEKAK